MAIQDPVAYIHSLGRFTGAAGLHRIHALLSALDDPQQKLNFVHLAGTNGKGSTAAMVAQILREAGYRTGLFTSPFLVRFHERICVDGKEILHDDLVRLTEIVARAATELSLPDGEYIGEFEFITAIALLYFWEQACDIVVLETGLGGEFDATNAINPPLVAAITSISLDHTTVLGDTVQAIAQAKAGIIKPGSRVVCASGQTQEAQHVIEAVCHQQGISLTIAEEAEVLSIRLDGCAFYYKGHEYQLALIGRHQVENACTALTIIGELREQGWQIPDEALCRGLSRTRVAGRLEKVADVPLTLLDGAHNPGGVQALCRALDESLAGHRLLLVLGMVADKAVTDCAALLTSRAALVFTCAPQNERALSAKALAEIFSCYCAKTSYFDSLRAALEAAECAAQPGDCILVTGSLYLVGEAKKIFVSRQDALK